MKLSFRRITSSGKFIPEIDGLRFIVIAIVAIVHVNGYIIIKDEATYVDSFNFDFLTKIIHHGMFAVPVFFAISGFILGLPFAKFYISNGKPINIKTYFIRRLTRLEPPYIIALTLTFVGFVLIFNKMPLALGVKSYLASLIYSHNIIFAGIHTYPLLNLNLWSLEIEIQFYILAPILAYVFSLNSVSIRRGVLIFVTVLFSVYNVYYRLPFLSIAQFLQYFLVGFLVADLYVSQTKIFPKTKFDGIIGMFFLVFIWCFETGDFTSNISKSIWEVVRLTSLFFLFYYTIFHKAIKFLSNSIITNIGGMCYSIYMLHSPIIYVFGKYIVAISFSKYSLVNYSIYSILLLSVILIISAIFFQLVEKPCMERDWHKKLYNRFTGSKNIKAISE
jgi:peptidoglycan/LPS O-acetylase OafA/YrhL